MLNDKFFLDIATRLAEESHCISLKVGAVIVKDNRIISMGYNGTPAGTINCDEALKTGIYNKEQHHEWSLINEIHAEMNALMFAVKSGISVDGCTMYVTHQPCDQCLKNICQSGIKRVVYITPYKYSSDNNINLKLDISIEQFKQVPTNEANNLMEINNKIYELNVAYEANKKHGRGGVCQRIIIEIDKLLEELQKHKE